MNKTMTVYLPTGERYFHTNTVPPERETREENFWTALGYVVTFTESAAGQDGLDAFALPSQEGRAASVAPAADPAPEFWDTP